MKEAQSKQQARKRTYEKTAPGTVVYMHKSRSTGSEVAVMRGPEEFGRRAGWLALCLTHHQFTIFPTRTEAVASSNQSAEWCSTCASESKRKGKVA